MTGTAAATRRSADRFSPFPGDQQGTLRSHREFLPTARKSGFSSSYSGLQENRNRQILLAVKNLEKVSVFPLPLALLRTEPARLAAYGGPTPSTSLSGHDKCIILHHLCPLRKGGSFLHSRKSDFFNSIAEFRSNFQDWNFSSQIPVQIPVATATSWQQLAIDDEFLKIKRSGQRIIGFLQPGHIDDTKHAVAGNFGGIGLGS